MTEKEAYDIFNEYKEYTYLNKEDEKKFLDAILYLIDATQDAFLMTYYGGYFYDKRKFDIAKQYYEMAAKQKYPPAYLCLGYIYYYGRVGKPNYNLAFKYYKKASDCGMDEAAYKLADMYKNGYGVAQDYDAYVSIIEYLYDKYKHYKLEKESRVGVLTRLARIRKDQGNFEEAINLFLLAKNIVIDERLIYGAFFGDINIIKWINEDLYAIKDFNYDKLDIFDIFYLKDKASAISFVYKGKRREVKIIKDGDNYKIVYQGEEYPSCEEFLTKATINGEALASQTRDFYDYAITK